MFPILNTNRWIFTLIVIVFGSAMDSSTPMHNQTDNLFPFPNRIPIAKWIIMWCMVYGASNGICTIAESECNFYTKSLCDFYSKRKYLGGKIKCFSDWTECETMSFQICMNCTVYFIHRIGFNYVHIHLKVSIKG